MLGEYKEPSTLPTTLRKASWGEECSWPQGKAGTVKESQVAFSGPKSGREGLGSSQSEGAPC